MKIALSRLSPPLGRKRIPACLFVLLDISLLQNPTAGVAELYKGSDAYERQGPPCRFNAA